MSRVTSSYSRELKTLYNLGLTLQQARVYLALAKTKQATLKGLSEAAKIDRGECYRIVSKLLKKRLISKIISSPARYEVVSFDKGVISLLKKRQNEISVLERSTEKLLEEFRSIKTKAEYDLETEDNIRFVPISPALLEKGKERFLNNQKSVCILSDFYRCESFEHERVFSGQKIVWKEGVNFKMLLSDPGGEFDLNRLQMVKKFFEQPGFSLRVISEDIAAPLGIHDGKVVEIYISKDTHVSNSSPLITTNKRMVRLAQEYFNSLWNRAKEIKLEKQKLSKVRQM